eukprot:CAMPEP_0183421786 /NCGR_PEP_ID=MMETSP0370-20130417/27344_1 /TAXON_ID=268820 /ORGANISM="Peridinium aciculiferum, Strain PAER-2" /LENGTH=143 /DNA_ID=CAMNT_0025605817 /DNA_START=417 /DNA_END=845 /DNA_ORIENTATION=+
MLSNPEKVLQQQQGGDEQAGAPSERLQKPANVSFGLYPACGSPYSMPGCCATSTAGPPSADERSAAKERRRGLPDGAAATPTAGDASASSSSSSITSGVDADTRAPARAAPGERGMLSSTARGAPRRMKSEALLRYSSTLHSL